MGADTSRFTFKPEKHYASVRMQQGRVQLDADWNEAQQIADRRWRAETMDIVGYAAVPETTPEAFRIQPGLTIGLGRMYVDGLLAENHGLTPAYEVHLGELYGTQPIPYNVQPYCPNPTALSTTVGHTDLLYLDVWEREVTALEDPEIREIALGGPDTTTRIQTVWQVKALTNVGLTTCGGDLAVWNTLIKPSAGRLSTVADGLPTNTDPCIVVPTSGYRGIENRLYRVEIHTPGPMGTAQFKWSRDNGSVVSAVTTIQAGNRLTVNRIGRDAVLRFKVGDWVEVLDDRVEFSGTPAGHLAKVIDIEEANRVLVLSPAIPVSFGLDATDPTRHTRVRRWDAGLVTVSAGPIALEDGIKVMFSVDATIGTEFKIGDAWVFAARSADASVELLDHAPPRSILHHYTRLALVTQTGVDPIITDCRTLYPPARCCVVVRPGGDIQAAINKLCATGGCICLAPGLHMIHKPLILAGCKNLTLEGVGQASQVVFIGTPEPNTAMIYIVGSSEYIHLENFVAHARGLDGLVMVDQDSAGIQLNQLTLINEALNGTDDPSQSACILLGNCCQVNLTSSTLVGMKGLVQVTTDDLNMLHAKFSRDEGREVVIKPIQGLKICANQFYVSRVGISLEDALEGVIDNNRIHGSLAASEAEVRGSSVLARILTQLACPLATQLPDARSGIQACLLDTFEITNNQIQAIEAILLSFAREVNIIGNRIEVKERAKTIQPSERYGNYIGLITYDKRDAAAITLTIGVNLRVEHNVIHTPLQKLNPVTSSSLAQDYVNNRARTGYLGIAVGLVRGITISQNQIHATSGIGTLRSRKLGRCGADYPESLLRVLGITQAWRVFEELGWVAWQFIQIAQRSTEPAKTQAEFNTMLLESFVRILTDPDLIPAFVGKATISANELVVGRFGICFSKVFTFGGLQILGNRISGFTETGILVHPWLSVSFPDLTAQLIYCGLEWILAVLKLLSDALDTLLQGNPPPPTTDPGSWTPAEIGVTFVSWTVSFCARYCGNDQPPISDDDPPPSSPTRDLKDAIDDLLNHLDLAWLDDLVNQSYVMDNNTLRGSGDGIWMGIDGSQISHNHVTIHPANSVPLETMLLGLLMARNFQSVKESSLEDLPAILLEMDRDLILSKAILIQGTTATDWNPPSVELRSTITAFLLLVSPTSPLYDATLELNKALEPAAPDKEGVRTALITLLAVIIRHLKGYGIALMGADMNCMFNQIYGTTSCGLETLTGRAKTSATNANQTPKVSFYPAIAGIWHFSNVLNLSFEIFATAEKLNNSRGNSNITKLLNLVELVIASFALLARKDRGLQIQSNGVEIALAYGIRTLDVTGLEEVSIFDNHVKNAVRYGIAHQSLISQDQTCCVKVHRNTVIRSNEVFTPSRFIAQQPSKP